MYLIEKSEKPEPHNSRTFYDADKCNQTGDISIK